MTDPVIKTYLEQRRKVEHRQSISETAQAILIDELKIPEGKLMPRKTEGSKK